MKNILNAVVVCMVITSILCVSSCKENIEGDTDIFENVNTEADVDKKESKDSQNSSETESSEYNTESEGNEDKTELESNEDNIESDGENSEQESQMSAESISKSGANTDKYYGELIRPK